jgi:phosphoenolpyruvate phosphomutase
VTSKPALLKALLRNKRSILMEAHNGISAKIVQEAGFCGIWASGFTMASSLGLRDANEASWTQILNNVELIADAADLPVLVDGDTGFGNFNNVRRLVRKLEQRGIAGVCLEDKSFPKANSFSAAHHKLVPIAEFVGKIRAALDHRVDHDFCVVARTEALIGGRPLAEALERAEAYREAGADAIVIHSKRSDAAEVMEFSKKWGCRAPLLAIPTTYPTTSIESLYRAGVTTVVWANHIFRGAVSAMRRIARQVHDQESVAAIGNDIASVDDILNLVDTNELLDAERRYGLPPDPS